MARHPIVVALECLGLGAFARAIAGTGLPDELHVAPAFTVLAPSDDALTELVAELREQPALLHRLLAFHIIPGERVDREILCGEPGLTTAMGQRVHVELEPDGILHVDGARLLRTDAPVGAGLVHVIDRVLRPAELDPIELLHLSDSFPRLLTACEVLGLEERLRGSLPYTLLAPRGLETLPTWEWHALLRPDARGQLERIIRRHLVAGRVYLDPGARLRNLQGEALALAGARGQLTLAGHRVAIADIEARNGLIHVIDGMLGGLLGA